MQKISILKPGQEKLAAYLFLPEKNYRYVIIICHGFRGTKENGGKILAFAQRLNKLELAVLAFDFSGSGESDGEFDDLTLSRQSQDLSCVIDYIHAKYALPVILLGRSFGGSTVLAGGVHDQRVAGYILWSTPIRLQETFAAILGESINRLKAGQTVRLSDEAGYFNIKPAIFDDFELHKMDGYLSGIGERPVLIVHGLVDEVVSADNAEYVYENLRNADLRLIKDADHKFMNKTREREDITIKWLREKFF